MTRVAVSAVALLAFVVAPSRTISAATASDPVGNVRPAAEPVPGQYIVTLRDHDPAAVQAAVASLSNSHGGTVLDVYTKALQGYAVQATADQAAQLAGDPAVASVEQNGYVHATTTQTLNESATPPDSWGLDRVDQRNLPLDSSYTYGNDGAGVHAYIIDTGINILLPDFGGRASFGVDEVGGVNPPGNDCAGHGTHVSGTVGGTRFGIAKQVSLVSVRVLDCTGRGTESQVVGGVDWVTANAIHPAVANMSLGGSISSAIDTAVTNSIASGITYTIAAGNSNVDACTTGPADVAPALTVGATTITDARANFSNYGNCVDVFAPGVNITSDWYASTGPQTGFTNTISGTSMAAPHVAGVAAVILGANPTATPATVAATITGDATPSLITGLPGPPASTSPNLLLYHAPPPPTVPSAPVLDVPTVGDTTVHLSWSAPPNGGSPITGYTVYRGTSSGTETALTAPALPAGQLSFDDTAVVNGTTYYYKVSATNAVGESALSNEQSAQPAVPTPAFDAFALSGTSVMWSHVVGSSSQPPGNIGGPMNPNLSAVADATGTAVFARGTDNALWWQRITPSGRSGWSSLGGILASDPAAVANGSEIDVFVRGNDNAVYWKRIPGTVASASPTVGYLPLGGVATGNPGAAVVGATKFVFVRGDNGAVYTQRVTTAPSFWLGLGGFITSDPTTAPDAFGGSGVTVVARGGDYGLYRQHVPATGSGAGWVPLGGLVTSNAGIVFDKANATWVFVRGGDLAVYYQRLTSATSAPGWTGLGGASNSDPKGVFDGANVRVAVRGTDNGLYWQTPGLVGWTRLDGNYGGNPALAAP